MRKTSNTTNYSERNTLRGLAAIALIGSLAVFGCSTNKYPGNGEPGMSAPAAGSVAPNPTSTPGYSSGGSTPQAMISSSPAAGLSAADDALAVLKADEGYRGKVLGPAAPGTNALGQSMQYATGQFISPAIYANPQITVNSSISSAPTPAIVSGAGEAVGGGAVLAAPAATGVTTAAAVAAPAAPVAATAAITNTTATPIVNTTRATTQAPIINTGLTTAPAAASSAAPTPILTTVGPMTQANNAAIGATSIGGSTLGVLTTATPTVTNTAAIAPVTVGNATAVNTTAATSDRLTLTTANTPATRAVTASIRTTSATSATVAAPVRVATTSSGAIVMTNEKSPSAFQRFLSAIGLRRQPVTMGTTP
ncbi:MAG TPA: hypothetical protein VGS96_01750 [Thermoanaerobaculia bacterium]|jgi:hypothetical protein|nr:hypothetical protein [Thermoanaerobaculia bacterium]